MWQLEKGEEGTYHYQGYVHFEKPTRFGQMKELMRDAHWEVVRDVAAAIAYCSKEESRVDGPFWSSEEFRDRGKTGKQGKRTDLDRACELLASSNWDVKTVATQFPTTFVKFHHGLNALAAISMPERNPDDPVQVIWLQGPSGIGKTRGALDFITRRYGQDRYIWSSKDSGTWFDGYRGESCIFIDELKRVHGKCNLPLVYLLRLINPLPMQLPIHGGMVNCLATTIVVTCNEDIYTLFQDSDASSIEALQRRIEEFGFQLSPAQEHYLTMAERSTRGDHCSLFISRWWKDRVEPGWRDEREKEGEGGEEEEEG